MDTCTPAAPLTTRRRAALVVLSALLAASAFLLGARGAGATGTHPTVTFVHSCNGGTPDAGWRATNVDLGYHLLEVTVSLGGPATPVPYELKAGQAIGGAIYGFGAGGFFKAKVTEGGVVLLDTPAWVVDFSVPGCWRPQDAPGSTTTTSTTASTTTSTTTPSGSTTSTTLPSTLPTTTTSTTVPSTTTTSTTVPSTTTTTVPSTTISTTTSTTVPSTTTTTEPGGSSTTLPHTEETTTVPVPTVPVPTVPVPTTMVDDTTTTSAPTSIPAPTTTDGPRGTADPVPSPSTVGPVVVSGTSDQQPAGTDPAPGRQLARTGADTGDLLFVGSLLVLLGLALVDGRRRLVAGRRR